MPVWAYPEQITLLRTDTVGIDEYGNDLIVEVEQAVLGCVVWPSDPNASGSNEDTQARDQVTTGYTVLAPPGTGILATDRIRLDDGLLYEIVGTPGVWRSALTNSRPGEQAALRRVTG